MKVDEIIKLLDAGYSKEEIESMEAGAADEGANDTTEVQQDVKNTAEKKSEVFNKEKQPKDEASAVQMSKDQFDKLLQGLNIKNENIELPPERSVDDIIAGRFASIMGVKEEGGK